MPIYKYNAIDKQGKVVKGSLKAYSPEELEIQLKDQKLLLIDYKIVKENSIFDLQLTPFEKKITVDDLIQIFASLGSMLESGINFIEALEYTKKCLDKKHVQKAIDDIILAVQKGSSFTEALKANQKYFPSFILEPIQIGETTGKLPAVLVMIADQLEKNKKIRDKIKKASIYPSFIIFALFLLITVVLNFVFPRIVYSIHEILAGRPYPPITSVIMSIAEKIQIVAPYLPIALVLFCLIFVLRKKIPIIKHIFDSLQLKIPYLRDIVLYKELINFLQIILIGIQSGISIVKSFDIAENGIENSIIKEKLMKIKTYISLGESLTVSFKQIALHPYLDAMIATGESSGTLEKTLENALNFFNTRVEDRVDKFFAWLEPIIIIILGSVVLFVLLGALVPMWESMSYITK